MRSLRLLVILFACLYGPASIVAQQVSSSAPAPRDPQAIVLIQRSLAAITGTTSINDITLSGSVTRIAGSDSDLGTVTLKATALGQAKIDLNLPSGQRSEITDISQAPPTGSWSGPDGTWHTTANHNLWTDPTWFYPTFLIGRVLSNSGYAISVADSQTLNGAAVQHITVTQQFSVPQQQLALLQGLSKVDIYLDSSNLLPVAMAFNIHPDNDALTNIPIRIEFANYQTVQNAQVPYHIQRFINNGLALDLTVSTVQINTGLTASDFVAR